MTRLHREAGAIEGFVMLALSALAGFAVVVSIAASLLIQREAVATAADMAVLAAAQTGDCAIAERAAALNGAGIVRCEVVDLEARVIVSAPTGFSAGLVRAGAPAHLRAAAHALLAEIPQTSVEQE